MGRPWLYAPATVVLPNATINTGCRISLGCIVNCGEIIDHDCVLEEGEHICPGAFVKGENRIPPDESGGR